MGLPVSITRLELMEGYWVCVPGDGRGGGTWKNGVVCINTKVGDDGSIGVRGEGGRQEGELMKKRGLAVCVQSSCRAWPSNQLPTTSTCITLHISPGLTHTQHLILLTLNFAALISAINFLNLRPTQYFSLWKHFILLH